MITTKNTHKYGNSHQPTPKKNPSANYTENNIRTLRGT